MLNTQIGVKLSVDFESQANKAVHVLRLKRSSSGEMIDFYLNQVTSDNILYVWVSTAWEQASDFKYIIKIENNSTK